MSLEKLRELKEENDQKGIEMMMEAGQFKALADRHNNGLAPRAVSSFNLFQTPEHIAERMVSKVSEYIKPGISVLEPSAGLGRLFQAVYKMGVAGLNYTLIEQNNDCFRELYNLTENQKNVKLHCRDFLEYVIGSHDLIIMNPPFKMGTDIKHILHAKKFLNPEGILISLCFNGVKQNRDLKPLCDTWEVLPRGSFKSEGTMAEVVQLTIKGKK